MTRVNTRTVRQYIRKPRKDLGSVRGGININLNKTKVDTPGCMAKCNISSTVCTSLSSGACRTMISVPSRHSVHPTRPIWPNSSFNNNDASTALKDDFQSTVSTNNASVIDKPNEDAEGTEWCD